MQNCHGSVLDVQCVSIIRLRQLDFSWRNTITGQHKPWLGFVNADCYVCIKCSSWLIMLFTQQFSVRVCGPRFNHLSVSYTIKMNCAPSVNSPAVEKRLVTASMKNVLPVMTSMWGCLTPGPVWGCRATQRCWPEKQSDNRNVVDLERRQLLLTENFCN